MEQKRICVNLRRGDGDELYEYLKAQLVKQHFTIVKTNYEKADMEKLIKVVRKCDALVSGVDTWNNDQLRRVKGQLVLIVRMGVGVDGIDIAHASAHGISVANTAGTNSLAVAEGAVALMLCLTRNIAAADRAIRDGRWNNHNLSRQLTSKNIGIVGYGNIGKRVVTLLQGFTHKILVYDPFINQPIESQKHIQFTDLKTLAQTSDVVSLHLPLTEKTYHLVDSEFLACMHPASYLINTSRGAIVDEKALLEALKQKKIAGAALDVFEEEPKVPEALKAMDNVVLTPHMLSATRESVFATVDALVDTICSYFAGKPKNIQGNINA
jgi:D-3-phosphoglycerate dehydrogenase